MLLTQEKMSVFTLHQPRSIGTGAPLSAPSRTLNFKSFPICTI